MALKRELGLIHVFAIASGAMISSGLFILPGLAAARAGPAVVLSYVIAGMIALPTLLSKAELTTAMPKAGGDYFYISRSMGSAVGTIGGFASWFSLSLKGAFALTGMAAYAAILTTIPIGIIAACLCVAFVLINLLGAKQAGNSQVLLVVILIGVLGYFVFRGIPNVMVQRFSPFAPQGAGAVFATAGFVFISFGGLTKVASIAEEVKKPGVNLPLGMFLSLLVVTVLYAAVIFVTVGVLSGAELYDSLTPISAAATIFAGPMGAGIIALAALLAFVSTANAGIMSASRYPLAMSRDHILPGFFQRANKRFGTPHMAILFTGGFMLLSVLFLRLEMLVRIASTLLLALYIMANLAVVFMRESRILNYQPKFKSPLYPWTQIAGGLGGLFLIVRMGVVPITIAVLFCFVMFGWYLAYVRPRSYKEFALLRIIERVSAKELTGYSLETELKDILRERDEIVEDRFDHVIKECPILDIEGRCGLEDFLEKVSQEVSNNLGIDAELVYDLLHAREEESSTVIGSGMAIPHIIVEGEKKFCIVIARSREGIEFYEGGPKVHTVFVLVGTRDERNFHLRALAAIAQIARLPKFEEKWMQARSKDELRDLILLGERTRHTPPTA
ncbi:amino acid permease [candidate division TA06 bacterium]|uniref:Amino acid permease n=1 Tax=candidate division TA06 bacterium TaxID=2250710 RepID=A0A523UVW5_UNCT6|nr:MAG: amino acid permease [candidate division TA06 bacterium]